MESLAGVEPELHGGVVADLGNIVPGGDEIANGERTHSLSEFKGVYTVDVRCTINSLHASSDTTLCAVPRLSASGGRCASGGGGILGMHLVG